MMNPEMSEKLQDEIFRKMPAKKKIKTIFQIFRFMNKLSGHKVSFKKFLRPLLGKNFPLRAGFKDILK